MLLSDNLAFVILMRYHTTRHLRMNLPDCNLCMELFRAFPALRTTFLGLYEEVQLRDDHADDTVRGQDGSS